MLSVGIDFDVHSRALKHSSMLFFVRDGINSDADYSSSGIGIFVVIFNMG